MDLTRKLNRGTDLRFADSIVRLWTPRKVEGQAGPLVPLVLSGLAHALAFAAFAAFPAAQDSSATEEPAWMEIQVGELGAGAQEASTAAALTPSVPVRKLAPRKPAVKIREQASVIEAKPQSTDVNETTAVLTANEQAKEPSSFAVSVGADKREGSNPSADSHPNGGANAGVDRRALLRGWVRSLGRAIGARALRDYPKAARRAGIQGAVAVAIKVDEQGRILRVHLRRSSGFSLLDEAALTAVASAGRLPAPPSGLGWDRRSLTVPVVYRLQ